jgi:hypothetical protein
LEEGAGCFDQTFGRECRGRLAFVNQFSGHLGWLILAVILLQRRIKSKFGNGN